MDHTVSTGGSISSSTTSSVAASKTIASPTASSSVIVQGSKETDSNLCIIGEPGPIRSSSIAACSPPGLGGLTGGGGLSGHCSGLTPASSTGTTSTGSSNKIVGRNANTTMVSTSVPSNEAELQLYRVLQRASLLAYFDTLLEMGGDDVQQLCDAGEEEFLEIMALVGMASKPLHVRRLQKALHEWATNPSAFQVPLSNSELSALAFSPEPVRSPYNLNQGFNYPMASSSSAPSIGSSSSFSLNTQIPSNPIQLTPTLTDSQVHQLTSAAERMSNDYRNLKPKTNSSKKRSNRELEQIIQMNDGDPRRMDEIRKYSAIYGRFDCKRRPEKPLTLHEVCINEAAAQLCKFVPAFLTRRDELFTLARKIVRDCGFGHSTGLGRYANQQSSRPDESEGTIKRARLTNEPTTPEYGKDLTEIQRNNLLMFYQKLHKPLDLNDPAKLLSTNYARSEYEIDTDSRYSFSSSSSPPLQGSTDDGPEDNLIKEFGNSNGGSLNGTNKEATELTKLNETETSMGVQILSASGSNIIAVANPALAMSPTLSDHVSIKRETV